MAPASVAVLERDARAYGTITLTLTLTWRAISAHPHVSEGRRPTRAFKCPSRKILHVAVAVNVYAHVNVYARVEGWGDL